MDDESSDILGQQTKPALRSAKSSDNDAWLGTSLIIKLVLGFVITLFLYVVFMRIWFRILVWKERSYKLATRRKHGIPDNDHRPFNVAYAAVLLARREREANQKAKVSSYVSLNERRSAEREHNARQRLGRSNPTEQRRASSFSSRFPGAYLMEGSPANHHSEPFVPSSVSHPTHPVPPAQKTFPSRQHEHGTPSYLPGSRASQRDLDSGDERGTRKRGYVEDLASEHEAIKRSKSENGTEVEGVVRKNQVLPQRVAKRYLLDDENEDRLIEQQPREKRARKVSLEYQIQMDQDMDVDEDDEDVDDLPDIQRGKKRDRTEAGSTFGGDDDESGPEQDQHGHKLKRRGRKRRTFSKRTADLKEVIRGQKRDRDLGDDEMEREIGEENLRPSRKKRGKRTVLTEAELSERSNTPSQRSFSSERKIGEEWTSNGIKWKIGDNGQRLRQALVKKAGQRFSMPEDSQHPDRVADFEVYVESWLTEEEYRDAKSRHVLVGQGTSKRLESKLSIDVEPHVNGKDLLWSAKPSSSDSPTPGSPESDPDGQRMYRMHRMNPFDHTSPHHMRRISSTSRTSSVGTPGLVDTTNSNPHGLIRTYSKLEKQELEARALQRLREMRNAKKVETNQLKAVEATKEKENLEKANTPASVPTITITAPTDTSSLPTQPGSSSLNQPVVSASFIPTQVEPPKPTNLFSFPTISKPSVDSKPPEGIKPSPFGPSSSTAASAFPFAPFAPSASKTDDRAPATTPSTVSQPTSNFFAPSTNQTTSLNTQAGKPANIFNMSSSPGVANNASAVPTLGSKPASGQVPTSGGNPLSFRLGSQTGAAPPSGSTSQSTFRNSASEYSKTSTSNLFPTQSSQSTGPTQTVTTTSTNTAGPIKFSFGLTGPSSAPSGNAFARPATAAPATAAPTTTVPSSNQFAAVMKNPYIPSTSFTPFTPDTGTKVSNELATSNSAATKPTPSPSGFGFATPNAAAPGSSIAGPGKSIFGAPNGGTSLFSTANTSHNPLSGSPAFVAKPTETKATESGGANVPEKPVFKFNLSGQPSSQNQGNLFASSSEGGAKSVLNSSSLFNALGNQPSSGFGSTSGPNASKNTNVFGTSNGSTVASNSAPPNVFTALTPSSNTSANIFGNNSTATSSVFSSTASKASEAPKSVFSAMPVASAPEQQRSVFPLKSSPLASAASTNNQPTLAPSSAASSSETPFKFKFELNKNQASSSTQPSSIFGTPGSNNTATSSNPLIATSIQPSSVFSAPAPGHPFNSTSTQPPSIFGAPSSNSAATTSNSLFATPSQSIFGSGNTATSSRFTLNPTAFGSTSGNPLFNPLGKASESNTASGQK